MSASRNCLFVLVCLGCLFAPAPARAQAHPPRFGHLTNEQGLSHDMILCILQDSQGFMSFGTSDGLNKYDGYTFTVYRHRRSDPGSLSENTIYIQYMHAAADAAAE